MTFRAWLEPAAVQQVHNLPDEALTELVRLMARVCDDPYDAVLSLPVRRMTLPPGTAPANCPPRPPD